MYARPNPAHVCSIIAAAIIAGCVNMAGTNGTLGPLKEAAKSRGKKTANIENQRCPDLGNGYYQNPILGGDYPDPSVIRVGKDYYMTHMSAEYTPGLSIWHSQDLVNWEPICNALSEYGGNVWAPELVKHKELYYIYFPAHNSNWVITAASITGPWSKPINLNVGGHIDPGHVVGPDGKRYLHLSGGHIIQLCDDGLSTAGRIRKVYDGWQYPKEWQVMCFCLESPKLIRRNGYYYLTVAEGGTDGPPTSHMVVSSRSKTPWGPWEHSPYNPIVHTQSSQQRWWSKGHGTLIDTPDGNWWLIYHAYENGYRTLGRQTLLEPIEWTKDGWFRVPEGIDAAQPIKKPTGQAVPHGMALSDDFSGESLGLQWRTYHGLDPERYQIKDGALIMKAKGTCTADISPFLCIPVNHAYEIQVELEISEGAQGGLVLFYNPKMYCGIGLSEKGIQCLRQDKVSDGNTFGGGRHGFLRMVNNRQKVMMYYSTDGKTWKRIPGAGDVDVSGYHHNALGGFLSLRAGIYARGSGSVTFRNFTYRGLD